MEAWLRIYKVPLVGALIGLVFAILLVTLGFFKTILILLLTVIGAYLALYLDRNNVIQNYFKRN